MQLPRTIVPMNGINILDGITIQDLSLDFGKYDPRIREHRQHQWDLVHSLPKATGNRKNKPGEIKQRYFVFNSSSCKTEKFDDLLVTNARDDFSGVIVFDGCTYSIWLDPKYTRLGVILCDLKTAEKKYTEQLLSSYVRINSTTRVNALVNAAANFGLFLFVPDGINLEKPILIDEKVTSTGIVIKNNVVSIGNDSQASIIRRNQSFGLKDEFLCLDNFSVMQCDNSRIRLHGYQNFNRKTIYLGNDHIHLERNSSIECINGQVGSDEAHINLGVELAGEGSEAEILGFYAPGKSQRFDIQTRQDHLAAHTRSDLHFKGVLSGQSQSIWSGMINVSRNAQKSESNQINNNLILDETAHIDSIPGMEILANDVKCKHGATIGKIDPNQLFYLESRGINRNDGEQLLVDAFLDPIIQKYALPEIRYKIKKEIQRKIKR